MFGAVVLALVGDTVPDRSRLIAVSTGKGWGPSAIRFTLTTDPRHFHYLSKAGHIADVWGALETAGRSELGVLIDPTSSHSPPMDERAFYTAFEIRVGARTIRPYAEVSGSRRRDNDIGVWLGSGTAIMGVALLLLPFWRRRWTRNS